MRKPNLVNRQGLTPMPQFELTCWWELLLHQKWWTECKATNSIKHRGIDGISPNFWGGILCGNFTSGKSTEIHMSQMIGSANQDEWPRPVETMTRTAIELLEVQPTKVATNIGADQNQPAIKQRRQGRWQRPTWANWWFQRMKSGLRYPKMPMWFSRF